jgi:hypothetical protein
MPASCPAFKTMRENIFIALAAAPCCRSLEKLPTLRFSSVFSAVSWSFQYQEGIEAIRGDPEIMIMDLFS